MREAIVLAGGFGTRLKKVVSNVPKPMAPINNKPFLEYIFRFLRKNNIDRVILSVGYKKEIIKDYFKDSFLGIEIIYSEEDEPLGTGGAIKRALEFVESKECFVLNGDTYFDINLNEMKLSNGINILIALKQMKNVDRYGAVEIDKNNYITSFREKQYFTKCFINGGVYLISKGIFDDYYNLNKNFSFERFLSKNFKKLKAKGIIFDDYFVDIGIPEDYEKAKKDLKDE